MQIGITGKQTITVTEEKTAQAMGSGTLPVFATPAMIALMENTASKSVEAKLDEGAGTVGMDVTCETKLVEVDRKRLVFEVKAYDAAGVIGEGTHERFIIDNERFLAKAEAKKN